jgi:hypothetical protein
MGRPTVEGDSPVTESKMPLVKHPSSTRHVKPGVNPRGPPRKAKYYWTTDSVIVARAKGEKYPF